MRIVLAVESPLHTMNHFGTKSTDGLLFPTFCELSKPSHAIDEAIFKKKMNPPNEVDGQFKESQSCPAAVFYREHADADVEQAFQPAEDRPECLTHIQFSFSEGDHSPIKTVYH